MTDVRALLPARRGHFALESGHHGDLWLDLEALCVEVADVRASAERLAERLAPHAPEAVCGPLVEGAFVALLVAERLRVPFTYSVPHPSDGAAGLFSVGYRLPEVLRAHVAGRRVAIVNDVINAGSAVRGTLVDLQACGARLCAIASLAVLGNAATVLAATAGVPLLALEQLPNSIWSPAACPLCAAGAPLTNGPGGATP
jgi:orotate phosphoribosyltransferase